MRESEARLAMLISGSGTTMEATGIACQEGGPLHDLVKPVVVIASRDGIGGIAKAEKLGTPVEVILRKNFPKGQEGGQLYGKALLEILSRYEPDIITLNGFLAQVSAEVIAAYEGRIFNQHPGPVPEFGGEGMFGRRVHAAVLIFNRLTQRQPQSTEVIAQNVHPQYDRGAVLKWAPVAITATDTVDDLQKKTLLIEHQVQIDLLKDVALGTIKIVPHEAFVKPEEQVILFLAKEVAKALYPQG